MCLVFSEAHRSNTLKASSIVASGKRGLRCSITLLIYLSCIFALKVSCWDCVGTLMLKADNPANTSCSEPKMLTWVWYETLYTSYSTWEAAPDCSRDHDAVGLANKFAKCGSMSHIMSSVAIKLCFFMNSVSIHLSFMSLWGFSFKWSNKGWQATKQILDGFLVRQPSNIFGFSSFDPRVNEDIMGSMNKDLFLPIVVSESSAFNDRYLDFQLHHPIAHKIAVIKTLNHRASNLPSTPTATAEEERRVAQALKKNGYPRKLIEQQTHHSPPPSQDTTPTNAYVTIPYVKNTSESIRRILAPLGTRTFFQPTNTLR